jgi:hypothetical protein
VSTHHHEHGGPAEGWQNEGSEATERTGERTENDPGDLYRSHGAISGDSGRFRPERTEADRFWSKVDRNGPEGCWLWLGQLNTWGYGHFRRTLAPGHHVTVKAHRFAYALAVGPIPPGLTLDHLCGRPACVRPDHLDPVTAAENLRRRHARRRSTEGNQP